MIYPEISILLPAYNGRGTIINTVESLLSQTFTNFELLICDDGSNDDTFNLLNQISDSRVFIFKNNKNLGIAPTLNKLIKLSNPKSTYVAMAEQDDLYYSYRLETQKYFLDSNSDFGMVSGIADHWDGNKITMRFPGLLANGSQYPVGRKMFLYNYKEQLKVVNTCMMFRKCIHLDNNFSWSPDYPGLSVDWDYILKFSLVSNIGGLQRSLVRLDRRPDRKSLTKDKKLQFQVSRTLIKNFFSDYPDLIEKKDFKYAMGTQGYLEARNKRHIYRLYHTLKTIILDSDPKRKKKEFINFINLINEKFINH